MRIPSLYLAHLLLMLTLLTGLTCSKTDVQAKAALPPMSIALQVTEQQLSATSAILNVTVRSSGPHPALTLQLRPPQRVKVDSNNAFLTLPASTQPSTQQFRYALSYSQLPVEDTVIVLSHATDETVFRAEERYTFGRTRRASDSIK